MHLAEKLKMKGHVQIEQNDCHLWFHNVSDWKSPAELESSLELPPHDSIWKQANKPLHGQYLWGISEKKISKTWQWLKKGNLKKETGV